MNNSLIQSSKVYMRVGPYRSHKQNFKYFLQGKIHVYVMVSGSTIGEKRRKYQAIYYLIMYVNITSVSVTFAKPFLELTDINN